MMIWPCKHLLKLGSAALLCSTLVSASASADTIYLEDFQSGKSDGWGASGDGDLRLTTYLGNVSLRLMKNAAAVTKVSTQGFTDVSVTVSFAAQSLEAEDECAAEMSTDGGKSWVQFFNIGDGADDAVTLHTGSGKAAGLDDNPAVFIGLRVRGDEDSDTCWADNIKLTGRPKVAAQGATGAGRFSRADFEPGSSLQGLKSFAMFFPSPGAKPVGALPPGARLEGRFVLTTEGGKSFHAYRDRFGDVTAANGAAQNLPPFDFEFVQDGSNLFPKQRGPVEGPHANWEWVLEPGKVWEEQGDGGFLRAAIPFALQERNANCLHYGALTFLWKPDGTTSSAIYQIAGETCAYFSFDMRGKAKVSYQAKAVAGRDAVIALQRAETAGRLAVKPMSELSRQYAGADPSLFGSSMEIDPSDMTAFGFVIDGTHYVGGCETRAGAFPDCDVLPLPSYSTAKSLVGGLASMRMELLHPGSMALPVSGLVPECSGDKWAGVTLGDALNMATGNFGEAGPEADEGADATWSFLRAPTHPERIKLACSSWPRKAKPGTTFAYHTSDTYILGTALAALWRQKQGATSDFYADLLVQPVWRQLGLSPDIMSTRRTRDASAQPFTGYGLTLHRDDVAKLAVFLNGNKGIIGGKPLLDPAMLQSALQLDPSNRGLVADGEAFRYRNGFWAWDATKYLGCARQTLIPFMSGFGGITVALFPNNTAYYYFSDGGVFAWGRAARESNRIRKFC